MYKYDFINKKELPLTVDEGITVLKYFDKVGLESLIKFAKTIDKNYNPNFSAIMAQFVNKDSGLKQFNFNYKNTIDFLLGHKIDLTPKGQALYRKNSLSEFFEQLKQEGMSFNDCIIILEELKKRGITHISKSSPFITKDTDTVFSDHVSCDDEKIVAFFSDKPIRASSKNVPNNHFYYDINFDCEYQWYIKAINYYALEYPDERLIDLKTFDIDLDYMPQKRDIANLRFDPENETGYQIIKSRF